MSKEFRRQVPAKERLCIMVVHCFMTVSMLYRRVCYLLYGKRRVCHNFSSFEDAGTQTR